VALRPSGPFMSGPAWPEIYLALMDDLFLTSPLLKTAI
jgi:hypothetical protein